VVLSGVIGLCTWVKASLPGSGRSLPLTQIPEVPNVSLKKKYEHLYDYNDKRILL